MANIKKKNILYSQLSSDYLSSRPHRLLVLKMYHDEVARERVPHLKLIILAVWLYCNRTEGFYARLDEEFYYSIIEDTDINEDEIKENINWLANHGYFNLELFHEHIITSVDIQEAYFTVVGRLRREMPDLEEMKYVLIDNIHNFYSKIPSDGNPRPISTEGMTISTEDKLISPEGKLISTEEKPISAEDKLISPEGKLISTEEKPISAEGKLISPEGKLISTEEKPISAEGKLISTEEKLISAEGLPCNSKYQYKYKENGFIEVLRSYCSSSPGPYNDNENYIFFILFFLLDVKNPAKEVENFVAYNETNGWATKKGVEYDTPRKRFSLALRYSQKDFTSKGRLQISGIKDITFKNRILAFLFELYQFYRNNKNFKHHLIMNPNTNCQFIPIDGVKFKIKLFVGLHTEEFLISDYDNVLDIGRAVIGSALQEIEFARAGKELLAIEPKEINN